MPANDARTIWASKRPVVLRREGRVRVRLPYAADNRDWLRSDRRNKPEWISDGGYWELPKAWFSGLVDSALIRYGEVWIIQPYREKEICAPACMNAVGHECECSCMGANHRMGVEGRWYEVSEALAVRWGERTLAVRHLKAAALKAGWLAAMSDDDDA
jgi:hypothetical protein